jgi:hypothetical protein
MYAKYVSVKQSVFKFVTRDITTLRLSYVPLAVTLGNL